MGETNLIARLLGQMLYWAAWIFAILLWGIAASETWYALTMTDGPVLSGLPFLLGAIVVWLVGEAIKSSLS